jgi:hypothetical protein
MFFIFFGFNFFFNQIFQVVGYHHFRIWTNFALVILIWIFEYLFYHLLPDKFLGIWVWWLIAQVLMWIIVTLMYIFIDKKKIFKYAS